MGNSLLQEIGKETSGKLHFKEIIFCDTSAFVNSFTKIQVEVMSATIF